MLLLGACVCVRVCCKASTRSLKEDVNEPLPNRFAYIMARGCRNLGRYAFLRGRPHGQMRPRTVFYWHWYIIVCFFFNFCSFSSTSVPKIQERVFFEKKEPLLGRPEESSPSCFLPKIDRSEFSLINLTFYPTHIDATDHIYPMGPPNPIFNGYFFLLLEMSPKPHKYQ